MTEKKCGNDRVTVVKSVANSGESGLIEERRMLDGNDDKTF